VSTADGLREIRTIEVGDSVWTKDEKTGELSLQPVTQTMTREVAALRLLDVGGETVRTTDVHPFWVEGKGWTKAGDIVAGDVFATKDGKQLTVVASTSERQGGPIVPASLSTKPHGTTTVYDLEVANTHTFFVSPQKILVHNKN
jgi:intein/homing endonuclease